MKKLRFIILPILFLMVVGCATQPKINLISAAGESLPNPYYIAVSTSKTTQLKAIFYYVGYSAIKDADRSTQYHPVYLDRRTRDIQLKTFKKLQVVVRVFNPTEAYYEVHSHTSRTIKINKKWVPEMRHGVIGASKLQYREYTFDLPLEIGVKDAANAITLSSKYGKEIYLSTGRFSYRLGQS